LECFFRLYLSLQLIPQIISFSAFIINLEILEDKSINNIEKFKR